jgi:hypothetical protein
MPKPTANEDKEHFMARCIPQLMDEGRPQDQAIAICNSIWEEHHGGKKIETQEK